MDRVTSMLSFVKVVELQRMRSSKVMAREILPNLISPLMVESGLRLTYSIVIMSGLSFLGFGQQPPAANWGLMINENRLALTLHPWGVVVPVLAIAVLTIGTSLIGDVVTGKLDVRGAAAKLPEIAPGAEPLNEIDELSQDDETAEEMGLELPDQHPKDGRGTRALEPRLGRARQHLFLARSDSRRRRCDPHAAPAFCRRQGARALRSLRARRLSTRRMRTRGI